MPAGSRLATSGPASLSRAEYELTEHHASAVAQFLRKSGMERASIDIIGFHGQTVLHKPEAGLTVQLGLGGLLADFTRCPVIYDLRAADVAAGGQGAPLVPAYHRAVTAKLAFAAHRHRQYRRRFERNLGRPQRRI